MMRSVVVVGICLVILFGAASAPAEDRSNVGTDGPALVELQQDVSVPGEIARLGDIAAITADETTAQLLMAMPVQSLPDLGRRTATAQRIQTLVKRNLLG